MDQHKTDVMSLVFGGLFVGLAVLLPVEGWFPGTRWVVPAAVLVLGIGLAVSAIGSFNR
jgi:hypothetical protein